MSTSVPILVVGTGPAGLAMALDLARNGVKVRIIDKSSAFHTGSRGFGIQPCTFELMQSLGVLEDVTKLAVDIPTMRAYKLPGGTEAVKTWNLYENTEIWPDRPYGNGKCFSQSVMEEVFRDHLSKYNVRVELGMELVAIQQDSQGVTATLLVHHGGENGAIQENLRTHYLVGADGAKGITRRLLGLTFQGETRDTDGMVWGDVEIQGLGSDYWHIWGKPGHFTIMARPLTPVSNVFGIGITGQNFDPTDLASEEKLVKFIQVETGRTDLVFGKFSWLSYFKPNMRVVNKFSAGRVFLVGDVAHVHSPTGGQGMNCSVQDSFNLAWKLAYAVKEYSSDSLLASYSEERLPVITQMLHATTALYTHTVAKKKAEDGGEDDQKTSGWFRWRNNALHLYRINYRWSPIIFDERGSNGQDEQDMKARAYEGYEGSVRAGDRAPDAPGLLASSGQEMTLFRIFDSIKHTILVFIARAESKETVDAVLVTLARYPSDALQIYLISGKQSQHSHGSTAMLVDRDGYARKAYYVDDTLTMVVVRPDQQIGVFAVTVEGLRQYLGKVFGT